MVCITISEAEFVKVPFELIVSKTNDKGVKGEKYFLLKFVFKKQLFKFVISLEPEIDSLLIKLVPNEIEVWV